MRLRRLLPLPPSSPSSFVATVTSVLSSGIRRLCIESPFSSMIPFCLPTSRGHCFYPVSRPRSVIRTRAVASGIIAGLSGLDYERIESAVLQETRRYDLGACSLSGLSNAMSSGRYPRVERSSMTDSVNAGAIEQYQP